MSGCARWRSDLDSSGTETRRAIEDEVADVLIFVLRFAERYRIDLFAAVRRKLSENARRYPVDRSRGRNAKADRE
jgi:NTP pyrophosphatase (non-canonical NTP hydrolase)